MVLTQDRADPERDHPYALVLLPRTPTPTDPREGLKVGSHGPFPEQQQEKNPSKFAQKTRKVTPSLASS